MRRSHLTPRRSKAVHQRAPQIVEFAPAKINLALHVTGRTPEGLHQLDSLVCFAAVGDDVALSPGPVSMHREGPFAGDLGHVEDDLCIRAAKLARAEVAISLTKNLPVASGIGGGSADAAAVLRGLERMGYARPADVAQLGADVPVCLTGGVARMQGFGERVTPLAPLPPLHLVLVNPRIALSTAQVFAGLKERDNPPLPQIPEFASSAALCDWLRLTRNDLETPAIELVPTIGVVLNAIAQSKADFSRMSGSGATCFGIYESQSAAQSAAEELARTGWWVTSTTLAPVSGGVVRD